MQPASLCFVATEICFARSEWVTILAGALTAVFTFAVTIITQKFRETRRRRAAQKVLNDAVVALAGCLQPFYDTRLETGNSPYGSSVSGAAIDAIIQARAVTDWATAHPDRLELPAFTEARNINRIINAWLAAETARFASYEPELHARRVNHETLYRLTRTIAPILHARGLKEWGDG